MAANQEGSFVTSDRFDDCNLVLIRENQGLPSILRVLGFIMALFRKDSSYFPRSVLNQPALLLRFLGPFDLVKNSLVLASSIAKTASATQEAGKTKHVNEARPQ